MGSLAAQRMISWRTALRLGRVSNLPTVWSNVIAATALAGGAPWRSIVVMALAMSALYIGGMYLNDAFDRNTDAKHRPSRPIPAGEASERAVFTIGFGLLALGTVVSAMFGWQAAVACLVLCVVIILYNWHHKCNPLSPLLMGLCRALVYIVTGAALGATLATPVLVGALVLLIYVAGLTLASKRGFGHVALMIAGISLLDAVMAASVGAFAAALVCCFMFALTLLFQRYISGT
jgi:4-hydroxybenzoate polyprenyltransferase